MSYQRILCGLVLASALASVPASHSQERYDSGDLKGFVKYTAFEIVQLPNPFTVRRIEGVVRAPVQDGFLTGVLVEIRDSKQRISATKTDARGHFRFGNVPDGDYVFKTTLSGFSSVVGTFAVRKGAKQSMRVEIRMPLGV